MPGGVFLGLVTHPATRFPESSTEAGLLPYLGAELEDAGVSTQLVIHGTNDYDPETLPITRAVIEASIDAELEIEARWRRYVDPSVPRWLLAPFMSARRVYRRRKFLADGGEPGTRMVRRLVNIELAHLALLRQAVEAGAAWCLIAEDDATCADPEALTRALIDFMSSAGDEQPKYVNVSRSFSQHRLRTASLMRDVGGWGDDPNIRVLASTRPVTNTVCAVLYRGAFLADLVRELDAIPVEPVVPIDWKLNEAIMRLSGHGALLAGDCWTLDPAPVIQSSMTIE